MKAIDCCDIRDSSITIDVPFETERHSIERRKFVQTHQYRLDWDDISTFVFRDYTLSIGGHFLHATTVCSITIHCSDTGASSYEFCCTTQFRMTDTF